MGVCDDSSHEEIKQSILQHNPECFHVGKQGLYSISFHKHLENIRVFGCVVFTWDFHHGAGSLVVSRGLISCSARA